MKEDLLNSLYCEFINRVNEVGVDVNRAISHPYTQSLIQYVCGLGPRKGTHLLKASISLGSSERGELVLPICSRVETSLSMSNSHFCEKLKFFLLH